MNRTQRLLRLSAWTLGAATLLATPALYHHAPLAAQWEAPARRNLQAALAALES